MSDLAKVIELLEAANKGMYGIPGDPSAKLNKGQRDAYANVHMLIVHALNVARSAVPAQASAPECRHCWGHGWEPTIGGERRACGFCKPTAAPVPAQGEPGEPK